MGVRECVFVRKHVHKCEHVDMCMHMHMFVRMRMCMHVRVLMFMLMRMRAGAKVSGRMKKHDSARCKFIKQVVFPRLCRMQLPNDDDLECLRLPGPNEIHGPDKVCMSTCTRTRRESARARARASARAQTL